MRKRERAGWYWTGLAYYIYKGAAQCGKAETEIYATSAGFGPMMREGVNDTQWDKKVAGPGKADCQPIMLTHILNVQHVRLVKMGCFRWPNLFSGRT